MPASKRTGLVFAAIAVAFGARVSAHRLDEFLQASRIAIERDRVQVEMTLTPGAAVADDAIREIDANRNGVLSGEEQRAYAGQMLGAVTLRVDDAPLRLQLGDVRAPDAAALRTGDGAITIHLSASVPRLSAGEHRLLFRNGNAKGRSVFLVNALVPEDDEVAVTAQERNGNQSELTIAFVVRDAPVSWASVRHWSWIGLAGAITLAASFRRRSRVPTNRD